MDSMCAVRNIVKGGGPVPELVDLLKVLWTACQNMEITLLPQWRKRSTNMMQHVDRLSKEDTTWHLRESFSNSMSAKLGVQISFPDVAEAEKEILRVLSRKISVALMLPRWEGKSWWRLASVNAHNTIDVSSVKSAVHPNSQGLPRWSFVLFVFKYTHPIDGHLHAKLVQ
jgi:hypothetical protein